MKKIILLLGAVIFLSSKIPTWAATSCRGRSDCPSGYECVYLDESGVPRLDSTNSANNAFCARIYQGVTSMPTRIQPTQAQKYAKEGEFCGAGSSGVVQCAPGLRCDESRNRINDNSSGNVTGERVGTGGICVKDISTVKPTIIDNCRLKICGDANCDGLVNSLDLIIWKRESENSTNSRSADFSGNGRVDEEDYKMLQLGLEKKCGVPTPSTKYAKEGEFCGAGPNGVVECESGLKCDYSRNRIYEYNGDNVSVDVIGAGGVCVRVTPIVKPTIIDNCRLRACGDANCDGNIDTKDRLVWIRERIRPVTNSADINSDGKITISDLTIINKKDLSKCKPVVTPRITVLPTRKPVTTPISSAKYAKEGEFCGAGSSGVVQCAPGLRCDESRNRINDNSSGNVTGERVGTGGICVKDTPTGKFCETNSDCQNNETCYQPPMPSCPKGQNCLDVMPQKYCRSRTETSPIPTDRSMPTRTSTRVPTREPVTKKFCETNSDCLRTETCYQPPMPTCSPGENCIQVMPQKYCKPAVVSEVTGVEEISKCRESKGDANRDGKINLTDYALWRYEYAKGLASKADFNCDKVVDLTDYKIWKESFMQTRSLMVSDSN